MDPAQQDLLPNKQTGEASTGLMRACFDLAKFWTAGAKDLVAVAQALEIMGDQLGASTVGLFSIPTSRAPSVCLAEFPKPARSVHSQPHISRQILSLMNRRDAFHLTARDGKYLSVDKLHKRSPSEHRPDIVTIILEKNSDAHVIVELLFETEPDEGVLAKLHLIATFVRESWKPLKEAQRTREPSTDRSDPILGPQNHYRLTPSEKRVCSMISKGMSPIEIATDLGLSIQTIRTHLKGSFAKTGTSGQRELVLLLCGQNLRKTA